MNKITGIICLATVSIVPMLAMREPTSDMARLDPHTPMDFRGAKPSFAPEQMVWIKPLIRMTACIFAERAVRHYLEPSTVQFAPCGDGGKNQTTLDANLIDMTVSGIAEVDKVERPFKVTLQHYPPSTDEDGFNPTKIEVGQPLHHVAYDP